MFNFKKKVKLVTHDGGFHADDVFAAATLILYFRLNKRGVSVSRTRDTDAIRKADIVFDVGGVYDQEKNRFDHHQEGGAGVRESGVPYAAFGLVWLKYGAAVAGGEKNAKEIDKYFVQNIDAVDNGVDTYSSVREDLKPITIQNLFGSFVPTWLEDQSSVDKSFDRVVLFAVKVLERKIAETKAAILLNQTVKQTYERAGDKKVIVLNEPFGRVGIVGSLSAYSDVLYAVYPQGDRKSWRLVALRDDLGSFKNRKSLPESWRGKGGEELQSITGVDDAKFVHNSGFLAGAKTREGALALAELAIKA